MRGKFVMVDGLDGSGKGVVVDALKGWALTQGLEVLDLREYWKTSQGFPSIDNYDVILSAEPTFTGWGRKIREKLIKNGSDASTEDIAEAYSRDRKELYEKVIIPAVNQDKFIFQERGVVSSLVYQPVQGFDLGKVMSLEGNQFCLDQPPDLLIITVVDPEVVMERLDKRDKKDDAIFEKVHFQRKIKTRYESRWLKDIFEQRGTRVIYLDTNPPSTIEQTKEEAIKIFDKFLEDTNIEDL